ncbi:hypothetical protein R1flu_021365 [Riccia fluitans]|uniref:CobW C-terminal domain-containing protein n=1 Tax=Riccia fluitans TaxID=41844 RepID=A0ABD1ZP51_9MARC
MQRVRTTFLNIAASYVALSSGRVQQDLEVKMAERGYPKENNQMSLAFEKLAYDKREGEGGRLGCTIVTGFLGCGKTTLVQHILKNRGDLQIAVLVNEFGEIDVDSLVLDSTRLNFSHGLSHVSLANGCACCASSGNLKEALRRTVSCQHNFDYVVIETSGLANPTAMARELEEAGVRLDLVVTVVDVENLDLVLETPVAKQQLEIADIVLLNKCDLVSLGMISDAEDRVEEATGGTKAVRCRFVNVPLDLVLNVLLPEVSATLATSFANTSIGFVSHEATTQTTRPLLKEGPQTRVLPKVMRSLPEQHEHDGRISSFSFCRDEPFSLAAFQDFVASRLRSCTGLLRVKGLVWFEESRSTRHIFHFSGRKRSEALHGGPWESQPNIELVFIGRDRRELEELKGELLSLLASTLQMPMEFVRDRSAALEEFAYFVNSDSRFKVHEIRSRNDSGVECHTLVMFGLVGSALRGVHEGDLNAALIQTVNGRGIIFLTSGSSPKSGHWLQISFGGDMTPEGAWCELKSAAVSVITKAFQGVCLCRCDVVPHMH